MLRIVTKTCHLTSSFLLQPNDSKAHGRLFTMSRKLCCWTNYGPATRVPCQHQGASLPAHRANSSLARHATARVQFRPTRASSACPEETGCWPDRNGRRGRNHGATCRREQTKSVFGQHCKKRSGKPRMGASNPFQTYVRTTRFDQDRLPPYNGLKNSQHDSSKVLSQTTS
jgi:hypothetical protein